MNRYVEILAPHDIEAIHDNALRILNEVGVIFGYEPALKILKQAGCRCKGRREDFIRFTQLTQESPHGSHLEWKQGGAQDIGAMANREWKRRIASYVQPTLPPSLDRALTRYVENVFQGNA